MTGYDESIFLFFNTIALYVLWDQKTLSFTDCNKSVMYGHSMAKDEIKRVRQANICHSPN